MRRAESPRCSSEIELLWNWTQARQTVSACFQYLLTIGCPCAAPGAVCEAVGPPTSHRILDHESDEYIGLRFKPSSFYNLNDTCTFHDSTGLTFRLRNNQPSKNSTCRPCDSDGRHHAPSTGTASLPLSRGSVCTMSFGEAASVADVPP